MQALEEPRRRVQWSLRAILVAVTMVGLYCALWRLDVGLGLLATLVGSPLLNILFFRRGLKSQPFEAALFAVLANMAIMGVLGFAYAAFVPPSADFVGGVVSMMGAAITGGAFGFAAAIVYGIYRVLRYGMASRQSKPESP